MQEKNVFHKNYAPHERSGTEQKGIIVAHFGASVDVLDEKGAFIRCHLRKNMEPTITGDYVLWEPQQDETGIILELLPRQSLLYRPEQRKNKLIAANINVIIIVISPPPIFSEILIDRYLIAAETLSIAPLILLNKIDLLDEKGLTDMKIRLQPYEKIGYPVIYSSIFLTKGLSTLNDFMTNKSGVLVGVSGVGKSSIISKLTHLDTIKINSTSHKGAGKHTTTTTRLYPLAQGGSLIDSPGVRDFSLWKMDQKTILKGFIEFAPYLNQCKFRNCQHHKEPGCALQDAVKKGLVSQARWESYCHILTSMVT